MRRIITDDFVIALRRQMISDNALRFDHHARVHKMSPRTVARLARWAFSPEADEIVPPLGDTIGHQSCKKDDLRDKARELYMSGKTYPQIVACLGVAKSSVSRWCRDLVREYRNPDSMIRVPPCIPYKDRPIRAPREKKIRVKKIRTRNGDQRLTNDDVLRYRRMIRAGEEFDWEAEAAAKNVTTGAIGAAVRGISFKHLNDQEAPITERRIPKYQQAGHDRKRAKEELAQEAIALRLQDPVTWTYVKLAEWLSEKTGKAYHYGPTYKLLRNRSDALIALDKEHPFVSSKPKAYPAKPKTQEQRDKERLARQVTRQTLREFTARENARERDMINAGLV